jgi:hypothetical protein
MSYDDYFEGFTLVQDAEKILFILKCATKSLKSSLLDISYGIVSNKPFESYSMIVSNHKKVLMVYEAIFVHGICIRLTQKLHDITPEEEKTYLAILKLEF